MNGTLPVDETAQHAATVTGPAAPHHPTTHIHTPHALGLQKLEVDVALALYGFF